MNANTSPLQSSADGPGHRTGRPLSAVAASPDLVTELAWFLARAAGWTPEDLDGFDGDPEFTAEVQAAMAGLLVWLQDCTPQRTTPAFACHRQMATDRAGKPRAENY